ncbi:alpha/beta fold hydrolase [Bacillus mycoides]|uniref:alpha/beta fold hydrolase n=1 Tax=Bacillus mycoides TaxID=1405 RepID=UPI001C00D760|nr:alpha/beta fold hydrolase [Bacillus mycoides]QWG63849.1 alpha/beta fold hydrolase [Bacillus mycoides]QWG90047.1 alpha/beta fold hydrolase [Bacillus mycoides]QWJ08770.1 alpha/beta fold hydrolase [Bacillus mycoides]
MWKINQIETSRGKFEYFQKGEGAPLCVTHLYSEYNNNGNTFANPFTKHYSVYLINLKGCGNSDPANDDAEYSMTEAVKDLEAIRVALHINKWAFAGHSTGGMLALVYATEAQESLTKIIAGGASASKEYASHKDCIYCSENKNFNRIVSIMNFLNDPNTRQQERKTLGREWALMSFYSEEKLEESLKLPNSGKVVGDRLNYFRTVEYKDYDVRQKLKHVKIPSLIYCGKHDAQCPYIFSQEIANLIPNATLTTFEESNHNPFVEEMDKFETFVKDTLY